MKTARLLGLFVFAISFWSFNLYKNTCKPTDNDKKELVCSVSNFVVTAASSVCDGEILQLNFTFTGTDFGLNGYTINASNLGPQSFNIGDPQVLFAFAECSQIVVFTIYDNDNPSCSASYTYGQVCCSCNINIDVAQGLCTNDVSSAVLTINGTPYPMVYIGSFDFQVNNISSAEPFLTYVVCTNVPRVGQYYK